MRQRTDYPLLARPEPECGCPAVAKAWGIAGILAGIIGFVIQPIIFAPPALIACIFSVRMGFRIAWLGIAFGALELVYAAVVVSQISAG